VKRTTEQRPVSPTVDVVILSWNRLSDTLQCVESALSQKGVAVHVWLVDQGSEMSSLLHFRTLAQQERVHLVELGHNVGVAAGRNVGMGLGQAPFIVSLDNDASFRDESVLRRMVERFESEPDLGAVAFAIYKNGTNMPDFASWGYPLAVETHFQEHFDTARFCGAGHAIRRDALNETQWYDENLFFFGEELDLSFQLVHRGYRICYDPSLAVNHALSPESRLDWKSQRFYFNVRNMVYLNYKYFRNPIQIVLYSLGYLVKGAFNKAPGPTIRGLVDGFRLAFQNKHRCVRLSSVASQYIQMFEFEARGSAWTRFQKEVLAPLGPIPRRADRCREAPDKGPAN
jgi:GT2 family glycosyltransferase